MVEQSALGQAPLRPSLADALMVAQRRVARRLAGALAEENGSVEEWRVLRALADGGGHAMGDLAEALVIPQPTLTRMVEGLVDASAVYRRQSSTDRRRVTVFLSRRGRQRLQHLDALVAAHEPATLEHPDLTELAALLRTFAR